MAIIISALQDALFNLKTSVSLAEEYKAKGNQLYYSQFRTAAIQSFEYTYDLSIKLIKRYLNEAHHSNLDNDISLREMLRIAFEYGFVLEPNKWLDFREERNRTSHGYNEETAIELYEQLPDFIKHAEHLLHKLESISNAHD